MNISNSFIVRIGHILRDRIIIDLVPSEVRNSIYSLIPTLISIFSIPLLQIAGLLIDQSGLTAGITFVFGICITGSCILYISLKLRSFTKGTEDMKPDITEIVTGG